VSAFADQSIAYHRGRSRRGRAAGVPPTAYLISAVPADQYQPLRHGKEGKRRRDLGYVRQVNARTWSATCLHCSAALQQGDTRTAAMLTILHHHEWAHS
jgi:hypothetical protein